MRNTLGGRAAALALVLLAVSACADPASVPQAGSPSTPAITPPTAPAVTPSTAPTTATPGACAWRSSVDEAAPQSGSGPTTGSTLGDGPPNHGDNRRWRHRTGVTPEEATTLVGLLPVTKQILVEACLRGDFDPARIQRELGAIAPPDGSAWAIQRVGASGIPSTAVDGYVQLGATCLVVALEPEQIIVETTTVIADGGCWEPPTH